jgi:hypothetical protein
MTSPNTTLPPDPFDVPPSVPSLSFRDAPIGTTYVGKVVRLPSLVQQRDFESNELKFWPDGNPMMTAVFHVEINGEERSVWCPKPSSLFAAVVSAQGDNGQRMAVGDTITISFVGERPNETNPRLNPAKQYAVKIAPHDPFSVQQNTSNGHAVAAAAPAVSDPPNAGVTASTPAAPFATASALQPTATPAPVPNDQAMALLTQIKGLIGLGLDDAQIRAAVPQATPDVLAAVRSIPQ